MKQLFVIILVFLFSNVQSQVALDWQFRNHEAYHNYSTSNMARFGNSTYICSQSTDTNIVCYIFRLDSGGAILNQDSMQHFDYSARHDKRMIIGTDGSVYLCGNTFNANNYKKIRLIKFDSLLNRVWDIIYSDSSQVGYQVNGLLYSEPDDNIIAVAYKVGGNSHLAGIKFDPSGNLIWESSDTIHYLFSETDYEIDHSGNVIFGGYTNTMGNGEDFTISKLDSSGNPVWLITADGSNHSNDRVVDLFIDDNNNIYASGYFQDSVRNKVLKYDAAGNELWRQDIYIDYPAITVDKTGALYVAGFDTISTHECSFSKFDLYGNLISSGFSDIPGYNAYTGGYFVSIQSDDSANVYFFNNTNSPYTKWFVAKYDSSMNKLFSFIYPDSIPNNSFASSLCIFEGGFSVAGAVNYYGELQVLQFHENFPVGVDNILIDRFQVYPNPAIGIINFYSDKNLQDEIDLKIFDIRSELVLETKINPIQNSFNVDLKSFESGIFFYRITSSKDTYSGRLVKID